MHANTAFKPIQNEWPFKMLSIKVTHWVLEQSVNICMCTSTAGECVSFRNGGRDDGARKMSIRPFCYGLHEERLSRASSLRSAEDRAH